ncbi:metalloregulator ArsR/SmtB family transcription factor [Coraliomargarita sp. SDUM461004]|uniref:Metalloregulator ArsR/SmtB family transcription factor n=1 Tax=Thalassobacterium sedimentorum TaxID=3041258 RepID=A0ABU1AK92_9BACT|nr:metalloregulator ArsR/SmtB family transcription factor [Coraliomargarita sp. SDUM461004]MDQ8195236.1 metalloregulator ArsR/SmtB family transcription factor [Coraliomargarita sp. SDUM461004]
MEYTKTMEASDVYKCIADTQRLRILNLLEAGSLCVCHLQELLEVPQVKMSKQLASMKQLGLIKASREGTWMIYSLVTSDSGLLLANIEYLRTAQCQECNQLKQDLLRHEKLIQRIAETNEDCPESVLPATCSIS